MKLARALRTLLALALLSAQQVALSHQIWHFGDRGTQPAQEELCGQHDALNTVAGAVDSPTALLIGAAQVDFQFHSIELPSATTPGLAPSSRGPPTLL